ncbi:MAG: thrombospondin type 3 repeat-containing protein [Myxococcota bacterium]
MLDWDEDGVRDAVDNCPTHKNVGQEGGDFVPQLVLTSTLHDATLVSLSERMTARSESISAEGAWRKWRRDGGRRWLFGSPGKVR